MDENHTVAAEVGSRDGFREKVDERIGVTRGGKLNCVLDHSVSSQKPLLGSGKRTRDHIV
jgi:hypothetical protein